MAIKLLVSLQTDSGSRDKSSNGKGGQSKTSTQCKTFSNIFKEAWYGRANEEEQDHFTLSLRNIAEAAVSVVPLCVHLLTIEEGSKF